MKFLADMGISPVCVDKLVEQGHDAVHLHRIGLHLLSDEEILRKARQEDRVVLTHDLDFGQLLAHSRAGLPSTVIFRLSDMRPASVSARIDVALAFYIADLEKGCILLIENLRIRKRVLPIQE